MPEDDLKVEDLRRVYQEAEPETEGWGFTGHQEKRHDTKLMAVAKFARAMERERDAAALSLARAFSSLGLEAHVGVSPRSGCFRAIVIDLRCRAAAADVEGSFVVSDPGGAAEAVVAALRGRPLGGPPAFVCRLGQEGCAP